MVKAISSTRKSRGRPSTGAESIHLRVLPDQSAAIDNWIAKQQESDLSRPEAIRRLVEIGLAAGKPAANPTKKAAARAAELAEAEIDRRTKDAPAEERTVRKRRVLKGPSIVRSDRKD